MKETISRIMFLVCALLLVFALCSCQPEQTPDETTVEESTADLSAILGVEHVVSQKELGCTPFSAVPADAGVVEAKVFDRELILTGQGLGNTSVTVTNTYGEEFDITVVCDAVNGISVSGAYAPDEKSVNVRDFGAGSADNATAAIQKAIDSLPDGGTVYIPRGTYTISQIQLKEGVSLKLEGMLKDYTQSYAQAGVQRAVARGDFAVLRTDGSGDMFINHKNHDYGRNGCSNFSVTGGMLDMKGKVRCFIWCRADNVLLKNVVLKDCPNNHAIQVTGSTNVRVLDCMFAGYNYTTNNTTAEVIQIEQTHPGAIGGGDNPASKFDVGEYYACANVEISGCYFGRSDTYDAPTYAIGHHGQVHKSAVTGLKITGCVFDSCRCSAIRYPAYSDVLISGNRFISDRANSVSDDAVPYQISLYLKDSDISIKTTNASGASVTAYYARKYACIGSIGTVIENNVFEFSGATKMRGAVKAVSNLYDSDVMYDTSTVFINWYTDTPALQRGFKLVQNRIEDLTVRGNKIIVDDRFAGNGRFFEMRYVKGLLCEDNTVEGKSYNVSSVVDGVSIEYAQAVGCTSMARYQREYTVTAIRTCPVDILLGGEGGMTLRCMSTSAKRLTLLSDGGRLLLSVNDDGSLSVTPVPDEGKTFAGYEVTSGTLTQNGNRSEFSDNVTVTAKFR
ncbi:MAG: glycosyl hydrolase family 28-related protein [Clostridiales bacterium]|nr:glycosyl hydrolase family 28-related protein [Clostridiales bacterium]